MKIVIAAGTGFLGKGLEKYFSERNHEVIILTRNPKKSNHVFWDSKNIGDWLSYVDGCDVLVNMAGKSVDCRYNEKNKKEILDSRIDSTNVLHEALANCKVPPKIWMNSSSATIYIHAETQDMDENTGIIGDDFSMNICKQWENAFFKKSYDNTRQVALRTSIVLGEEGGAYPKMKMITILGLGGKQGRGNQYMSIISINDFCKAIDFIINNRSLSGPVNVTSPTPIKNIEFMKNLRKKLNPLFHLSSPIWILEIASIFMSTETELLLKSRKVVPRKLLEAGFKFNENYLDI
jgi:hypothetical protein